MELAATGFNSSIFSRVGFNSDQNRAADGRPADRRQNPNKPTTANDNAGNGRVIPGEVLDKQVETVYRDPNASNQPRSFNSQPENRRISPQQAIQTFQQNEAIPTNNTQSRQVSGIIDIFV